VSVVERFFERLRANRDVPVVHEVRGAALTSTTGGHLLDRIAGYRGFLRSRSLKPGDRVAWVAANGIDWIALDLAVLAEDLVAVPWYPRQDPRELAQYADDCDAALILAGTEGQAESVRRHTARPVVPFSTAVDAEKVHSEPIERSSDPFTLVYTSGTTGTAKGAILTEANAAFMLPVTASALEAMMGTDLATHRVFHYLPLCFMGSRIVLWTCLWRGNPIHLSTDLDGLAQELATARPNYVLNVPLLLERMRSRVEGAMAARSAPIRQIWSRARRASEGSTRLLDRLALAVARRAVFPAVRSKLGPDLRCLICGSAPLASSTQAWFAMLGLPVYQVYGLTETTAIATMDVPPDASPGTVGRAVSGIALRLGEDDELQVRGPNVFPGYWNRPDDTRAAFTADGWFRTGDQASLDHGRVRISGRVKSVLVLASGHKVAPEPIEEQLRAELPAAGNIVVVGHDRKALAALIAGRLDRAEVDAAIGRLNAQLPHYRRIAAFHLHPVPFDPESGLVTANQKLKRKEIDARFAAEIDALYAGAP
jgi:long-chain acyl-CoA synthetase